MILSPEKERNIENAIYYFFNHAKGDCSISDLAKWFNAPYDTLSDRISLCLNPEFIKRKERTD